METLAIWNDIKLTFSKGLGLTVWQNGRLAGCQLETARAMELVNALAGETVWAF